MRNLMVTVVAVLIAALIFFGGVSFFRFILKPSKSPPRTEPTFQRFDIDRSGSVVVYFFNHKGHDYITTHRGGIMHSASCTNHAPIADSTEKAHPDNL